MHPPGGKEGLSSNLFLSSRNRMKEEEWNSSAREPYSSSPKQTWNLLWFRAGAWPVLCGGMQRRKGCPSQLSICCAQTSRAVWGPRGQRTEDLPGWLTGARC